MRFPRMDFYPENWLSDTNNMALTFEEQGVHMYLLCRMWDQPDCTLPDDDAQIARWLKVTVRQWRKWRTVLVDGDYPVLHRENGRIFSKKLREIFEKAVTKSKTRADAANARWDTENTPETTTNEGSSDAFGPANASANADANASEMHEKKADFASPIPHSTYQHNNKRVDEEEVRTPAEPVPLPGWFAQHWTETLHSTMPPSIGEIMATYRRPSANGPPLPWEVIRWAMTQAGLKSERRNKWPLLETILDNLHAHAVTTVEAAKACPKPKGAKNHDRAATRVNAGRHDDSDSLDDLVQGG